MKRIRPNASRRQPQPEPEATREPIEKPHLARRKINHEAAPSQIVEPPLLHFSPAEVESRLQAFLNRPRPKIKERRPVKDGA